MPFDPSPALSSLSPVLSSHPSWDCGEPLNRFDWTLLMVNPDTGEIFSMIGIYWLLKKRKIPAHFEGNGVAKVWIKDQWISEPRDYWFRRDLSNG